MEVELKLLMDAADLARVSRAAAVSRARRGRARSMQLHTVYYDTPEGLLWRNGVSLRLRRTGSRWVQTVKGAGEEFGGLHRREEIEWPVAALAIDPGLLLASSFSKLFSRAGVLARLAPVFETEFRRRSIELDLPDGTKATLCLDEGDIRAGGALEPICEAEVELALGEAAALLDFARDLLAECPFRIGTLSKAERGHALASSAGANGKEPARAGRVDLGGITGTAQAFGRIVQSALRQIHANERGFLSTTDPEYLHQLRVGLRRLRVALALPRDDAWEAASRPLRERLRALSRLLGEARNWDVFAGESLRPMSADCDAKLLAGLRARAGLRRRTALAAAREAMRSRDTTLLMLELARLMLAAPADTSRGARAFAAGPLNLRYRRLLKAAGQTEDADKLHRLRIAAKKLRYVCEFFADLYPRKKVKRFQSALATLQDELGAVNDAVIGLKLLGLADSGAKPLGAEARGIATGWIASSKAQAAARAREAIRKPLEADTFWK